MGYMTLTIVLKKHTAVLAGPTAELFDENGDKVYEGDIDNLPPEVLQELVDCGAIRLV